MYLNCHQKLQTPCHRVTIVRVATQNINKRTMPFGGNQNLVITSNRTRYEYLYVTLCRNRIMFYYQRPMQLFQILNYPNHNYVALRYASVERKKQNPFLIVYIYQRTLVCLTPR